MGNEAQISSILNEILVSVACLPFVSALVLTVSCAVLVTEGGGDRGGIQLYHRAQSQQ